MNDTTNIIDGDQDKHPIKCNRLSEGTETDWCLAEACRESLREHMSLLKIAQERIVYLEELRMKEIVIGERFTDDQGNGKGTIVTSRHWDKRVKQAGLVNQWCQIIIRPLGF